MRQFYSILVAAALLPAALACFQAPAGAAEPKSNRLLYFTRSVGFEHSAVNCPDGGMSLSGKVLSRIGKQLGFEVDCTKDGRVFEGNLDRYGAIGFFTFGDLTRPNKNGTPPISPAGKQRLLDAIAAGKGFLGFHSTCLCWRSRGAGSRAKLDPFIAMLGGELQSHGKPQEATVTVTSPGFPGTNGLPRSFSLSDEWYVMRNCAPNLHVILTLRTEGLKGACYRCPPTPVAWARTHGKGRVFFTSMGDQDSVWNSKTFQQLVQGGLAWIMRHSEANVTPNIKTIAPAQ